MNNKCIFKDCGRWRKVQEQQRGHHQHGDEVGRGQQEGRLLCLPGPGGVHLSAGHQGNVMSSLPWFLHSFYVKFRYNFILCSHNHFSLHLNFWVHIDIFFLGLLYHLSRDCGQLCHLPRDADRQVRVQHREHPGTLCCQCRPYWGKLFVDLFLDI